MAANPKGKTMTLGFSLDNARIVSKELKTQFPNSWDEAIIDAANGVIENEKAYLYIPCHADFSEAKFLSLLQDPVSITPIFRHRTTIAPERQLYSFWESALDAVVEEAGKRHPHKTFLVYDIQYNLLVDWVDRTGKSLMPPAYLDTLMIETGLSLEWEARPK